MVSYTSDKKKAVSYGAQWATSYRDLFRQESDLKDLIVGISGRLNLDARESLISPKQLFAPAPITALAHTSAFNVSR